MKLIVISSPDFLLNEGLLLTDILKEGVDYLHIRKPNAEVEEVRQLLNVLPTQFHDKIKLHYFRELLSEYPLIGYHHSSQSTYDRLIEVSQSKSFHQFEEIESNQFPYDYCFLSPVFPSISKQGYSPTYSLDQIELFLAQQSNQQIIALGGVNEQNCKELKKRGFSGVAIMGTIWNEKNTDSILKKIVSIKKQLTL